MAKPISVRINEEFFSELQKIASEDDRSVSYIINKAIEELIKRHKQKADKNEKQHRV